MPMPRVWRENTKAEIYRNRPIDRQKTKITRPHVLSSLRFITSGPALQAVNEVVDKIKKLKFL